MTAAVLPELVGTGDIAKMLRLSRDQVVRDVVKRPGFPPPCLRLSQKTVRWSRDARSARATSRTAGG